MRLIILILSICTYILFRVIKNAKELKEDNDKIYRDEKLR